METKNNRNTKNDEITSRAQVSLLDSLSAVSAAIDALPDDFQPKVRGLCEQFMRADATLAHLYKQILEARANLVALVAKYGMGDTMVDTLTYNLSALEAAYAQRLALLRKRREEQSRAPQKILVGEEANANTQTETMYKQQPRKKNTLWFLAAIMMIDAANKPSQQMNPRAFGAAS